MQNDCVVMCPYCGQFIQVDFSIIKAQAYPFSGNFHNSMNTTHGAIYKQEKEENDSE